MSGSDRNDRIYILRLSRCSCRKSETGTEIRMNGFQCLFFTLCAPGGARFLRVKVPNPPGSGKDIAEGKGAHCEVGSEGSRMWGNY